MNHSICNNAQEWERAAIIISYSRKVKRHFLLLKGIRYHCLQRPSKQVGKFKRLGGKRTMNLKYSDSLKRMWFWFSLSVLLDNRSWWQCNLYARGYFSSRLWIRVTDVLWWYSALRWALRRRLALHWYYLPWIIWIPKQSSESLCYFASSYIRLWSDEWALSGRKISHFVSP